MSGDPDAQFERMLLASARGDAGPRDLPAAWARFARALELIAVGRDGAPGAEASGAPGATAGLGPSLAPAMGGGRIAAWVLAGALGGSGITAAVMSGRSTSSPTVAGVSAAGGSFSRAGALPLAPPGAPSRDAPSEPAAAPARGTPAPRRHAAPVRQAQSTPSSTLAAEVARIDAARRAGARGDHDEAIRLVDDYRLSFPDGVLAADAEVVALEAAAAKHDRDEVAQRAAAFLSRHPRDPHAARVRWIAANVTAP